MGLIMLILIGVVPTAYALNGAMPDSATAPFVRTSTYVAEALDRQAAGQTATDPRRVIGEYLRTRQANPAVVSALSQLAKDIRTQVAQYGSLRRLPQETVQNVRNDMYLAAETIRRFGKDPSFTFSKADMDLLKLYRTELDGATRFIPTWVKIPSRSPSASARWSAGSASSSPWAKRSASHLTYAQGASAELVAATTIAAADIYGLPVSATQVLSSGVAGTMAARRSGLQSATVRNLLMAWVLTLPAAILLSGSLFWIFAHLF